MEHRTRGTSGGPGLAPLPAAGVRPADAEALALELELDTRVTQHRITVSEPGPVSNFAETQLALLEGRAPPGPIGPDAVLELRIQQAKFETQTLRNSFRQLAADGPSGPELLERYRVAMEGYDALLREGLATESSEVLRLHHQEELRFTTRSLEQLRAGPEVEHHPNYQIKRSVIPTMGEVESPAPLTRSQAMSNSLVSGAGRVFGGAIVLHSIEGMADLWEDFEGGTLDPLEGLVGGAHAVQGLRVGVTMARGNHVGRRGFWFLLALEVADVASQDYDSEEAWLQATLSAGARAVMTAILMELGGLIIRAGLMIPHPAGLLVVAIGLGLVFLADPLLEALGVYDLIERWTSFEPNEVTGAHQELRDLLDAYSSVIGARQLVDRGQQSLSGPRIDQPLQDAACRDIELYFAGIIYREHALLEAFEAAYEAARDDHVGLIELDALRVRYLRLQDQALHQDDGGTTNNPAPREVFDPQRLSNLARRRATATFAGIDRDLLPMDGMTASEVREMEQWEDLEDELDEYESELDEDSEEDVDWDDVDENHRKIDRMLRHIDYRMHPARYQAGRTEALISPDSEAGQAYLGKLLHARGRFAALEEKAARFLGASVRVPTLLGPWEIVDVRPSATLQRLEGMIRAHEEAFNSAPGLVGGGWARDLHQSSTRLAEYRETAQGVPLYMEGLERLQVAERLMLAMRGDAARALEGQEGERTHQDRLRLYELGSEVERRIRFRRDSGYLFMHEVDQSIARVRTQDEVPGLARLLGQASDVVPLTPDEEFALEEGGYTSQVADESSVPLRTTADQLERLPSLQLPVSGVIPNVWKVGGGIPGNGSIRSMTGVEIRTSQNLIVGEVERSEAWSDSRLAFDYVDVLPLNASAMRFWQGHYGNLEAQTVLSSSLHPVAVEDLR